MESPRGKRQQDATRLMCLCRTGHASTHFINKNSKLGQYDRNSGYRDLLPVNDGAPPQNR